MNKKKKSIESNLTAGLAESFQKDRVDLQTVIDAFPDAMIVIGRDYRIVLANRAARDLADGEDLVGEKRTCYRFSHHRDSPCTGENDPCPLKQVVKKKTPWTVTHKHFDGSGKEYFVEVSAVPIFSENGEVDLIIETVKDITARIEAERMQKTLNENLEKRVTLRTQDLKKRAAQLRALAEELTLAEQQERQRMSHLLHDHLQQLLVGAKFHLGVLQQRHARGENLEDSLREIEGVLDQSINASRSLAIELSPPILNDAGLDGVLEWLASWMKDHHGLTVVTELEAGLDPKALEDRVLLYQATREVLFNVVKHAGVDQARLRLSLDQESIIRIEVSDSGKGFDPEEVQPSRGFGLHSIRERLHLHGGRLELQSVPGKGSVITLLAPMEPIFPKD